MEDNKETKSSTKDIIKFLTKGTIFCIILAIIMYVISPIFVPKWKNKVYGGSTRRIQGIYTEPKNTIDLVTIGNSNIYAAISTTKLWKDMGITSYHTGTPMQTTWISYYILKDFLKRQEPKLAVIDMNFAFEKGNRYKKYIREDIDNMPMSINKLEMINDPVFDNSLKAKISFIFPVIRFHSRWSEITMNEVKQAYQKDNINFKGYEFNNRIDPYKKKSKTKVNENKSINTKITKESEEYLDKIVELCKENNTQVLLIYIPTATSWNQERHNEVQRYAKKQNLKFIDYNLEEFDWEKYTRDKGIHLNTFGAEIITEKLKNIKAV